MSLYLEQIRQLVALQRVDNDIRVVQDELTSAPATVDDLTKRFEAADALKTRESEKMEHLLEQDKRVAAEIEEDATRIHKSRSKLMQVSNSREYQAMAREMDSMEKVVHSREEERTAITEAIKSQRVSLEEANTQWETLNAQLTEARANLDERMAAAQKRLETLQELRSHTGNEVPRPVLERYEFISRRLPQPVIVPVRNSICQGCHISIPPQAYIELQGGQKILNCPNCQRLIYWSEHFSDGSEAQKAE